MANVITVKVPKDFIKTEDVRPFRESLEIILKHHFEYETIKVSVSSTQPTLYVLYDNYDSLYCNDSVNLFQNQITALVDMELTALKASYLSEELDKQAANIGVSAYDHTVDTRMLSKHVLTLANMITVTNLSTDEVEVLQEVKGLIDLIEESLK